MTGRYRSFEDRGVYVGFRTRMVELCRVRVSRSDTDDDYEALIPNWTGRDQMFSNDLIMRFMDVRDWASLSERDVALHERLSANHGRTGGHLDPIMMREIRLEIDAEVGDEADRQRALRELRFARLDAQNAFLEILAMFGRNYAHDVGGHDLDRISRPVLIRLAEESRESLERLVRIIARAVSRKVGITRELLQERLDRLTRFAAPVCSLVTEEASREVGYLSRQQGMLEALHRDVVEYGATRSVEIQDATRVIDFNVRTFLEYAIVRSQAIKTALLDESFYLDNRRYNELLDMIGDERVRISYALDGWANHAERWDALPPDDVEGRDRAIGHMLREMPSPTGQIEGEVGARIIGGDNLMSLRNRVVKEMHSWSDDTLDAALHARVMKAREKAAADAAGRAAQAAAPSAAGRQGATPAVGKPIAWTDDAKA